MRFCLNSSIFESEIYRLIKQVTYIDLGIEDFQSFRVLIYNVLINGEISVKPFNLIGSRNEAINLLIDFIP